MSDLSLASRTFASFDQQRFAALSGDFNPIHVDPIAARRTQAGMCVVHGVHAVLWALDALIASGAQTAPIARLKVQFNRFIPLDREVVLSGLRQAGGVTRVSLLLDGAAVVSLEIGEGPAAAGDDALLSGVISVPSREPVELDVSGIPGSNGWIAATGNTHVAALFPHVAGSLGQGRLEAITQLSTLVRMVCPGLHSLFSGFDITITKETDAVTGLSFRVNGIDDRFRLVDIAVIGHGMRGNVAAFVRQPPVAQLDLRDIVGRVNQDEFRGTTALVVGGSRGLGALTARIIAAGGGRVIITYLVGEAEAREIAAEIGQDACQILRYDVRKDADDQLFGLENVNQVYYFATPQIFRQKQELFAHEIFDEFYRVYVAAFHSLCVKLQRRVGKNRLALFYPSSLAVEERPRGMTEYSMAKAAGEQLCADLKRFLTRTHVVVRRLPRLLTDQTATVTPVRTDDSFETMLPIVREMYIEAGLAQFGPGVV